MSLTPIDEGRGTTSALPQRERSPPSRRERILAGLKSFVAALPFGRKLVPEDNSSQSKPDTREIPDDRDRNSSEKQPSRPLPKRTAPFTQPSQNGSGDNAIELVGEQNGETLTIMFPDHPDTAITSDVFEEVER